uniref:HDC00329 n=1 Tax=Drosophila melanogaster TaxID=7227 RepID=Q6IHY6_DROME|nr:TPA_inf: HDC00329 [Drosophila melanogaster]
MGSEFRLMKCPGDSDGISDRIARATSAAPAHPHPHLLAEVSTTLCPLGSSSNSHVTKPTGMGSPTQSAHVMERGSVADEWKWWIHWQWHLWQRFGIDVACGCSVVGGYLPRPWPAECICMQRGGCDCPSVYFYISR